jgi:hypothetical protein
MPVLFATHINRSFISLAAVIVLGTGAVFPQTPAGTPVALLAKATNKYVVAWDQGKTVDLHASALHADPRAEFEIIEAGNGSVAVWRVQTKKFWTVSGAGPDVRVLCSLDTITREALFTRVTNSDGTFSLKSISNGRYLAVVEEDTIVTPEYGTLRSQASSSPVITPEMLKPYTIKFFVVRASGSSIGDAEKFEMTPLAALKKKLTAGRRPSKVLTFLDSISGKKTVTGIHNREPNSDPAHWTDWIYSQAGVYPALWGGDFLFEPDNIANRGIMIDEAKNEWAQGAVVNLLYHLGPPTQAEACGWNGGVLSMLSNDQWAQLITDGTPLNDTLKQRFRNIAEYLQQLKDAGVEVLYRPFHEMNQSAFWWGGRPGSGGTARLFQIAHDYLIDTLGLSNVFFVWSVQDLSLDFSGYDPGDAYWDIFTLDVYNGDGYTAAKYQAMLDIAGTRLIGIAECATVPTAAQLLAQPRWVYFSGWSELTTGDITGAYTAANTLSRDEMPGWNNIIAVKDVPQAAPSPLQPSKYVQLSATMVRFFVPKEGRAIITVHDARGRLATTLVDADFSAGWHCSPFGHPAIEPGIYFVEFAAGNLRTFQKAGFWIR